MKSDFAVYVMFALLVAAALDHIATGGALMRLEANKCSARGGVLVENRSGSTCIKRESVITT